MMMLQGFRAEQLAAAAAAFEPTSTVVLGSRPPSDSPLAAGRRGRI
jgi:hypothetical protein